MSASFRINTVAIVALAATPALLIGPDANADLPPRWTGTAQCLLDTFGPYSYVDRQTHTWSISAFAAESQVGTQLRYAANWTVTGSGSKPPISWTTNGSAAGANISFRVDPNDGLLHVGLDSMQLKDANGIHFADGSTGPIWEWQFPAIAVPQGTDVALSGKPPVNGNVGWQSPGGSHTNATCTFKMHYGPVKLFTPPRFPHG
jgi:hypothetical protein